MLRTPGRGAASPQLSARGVIGQHEVREHRGLVGHRGGRHHELHLGERLARSRSPRAASARDSRRARSARSTSPAFIASISATHGREARRVRGRGRDRARSCRSHRRPRSRAAPRRPSTVARELVSATPGGSATGRFAVASAAPIRRIASADTSALRGDGVGAEAGELARDRRRGDADLAAGAVASTATRAIASARMPSVPGFARDPLVGVRSPSRRGADPRTRAAPRGPSPAPRRAPRRAGARARPARGRSRGSRSRSRSRGRRLERSKIGTDATPNTVSVASRSASGANGS